ncbi:response regulator [Teredinibacter sp. KSP-S5-2]|uniref:response regulator n=1 Tax=Teredinibacter sp. KSP-S5-2 TaxID=3034506 RepID=UPI0029351A02|nr:response regulator [Teredinibacter sp. KSP-S5-2]WNO09444.1 response regulator [Teredinibacter sp. KSP-S5-2]
MAPEVSRIKFTDGLSYKQARLTIIVAMILGLIVSLREVSADLDDTRRAIDETVRAIITSNLSAAAHITQSIDSELANELAEGMIKHPSITRVFLVDSFNDVIGAAEEKIDPSKQNPLIERLFGKPYQVTQSLINPYATESELASLGQLVVIVDSYEEGKHFLENSISTFVATFIQTLALSLILMTLFYFRVTQPLKRVTEAVASLDPRRSDNRKITIPDSHKKDEIGQLIQSYNNQLMAIKEHLIKRQDAEKELKYYMADLEERVEERTAEANEARQYMQSILDNSPVAIARLDGDGFIQQVNPAFIEMFGYSEEQLLYHSPINLFEDPAIYEFISETIDRVVSYTQSYEVTVNMVRRDGTVFSAASGNRPIDPNDLKSGYIWSLWDMSDRAKMEKALLAAKEQAEAATRAKSDFLANMSHELRTPMNAILGMTWLALRTALDDQQKDYLTKVRTSAESLLTIVNDILDFSKIEAGKLDIEVVPFTLENVLQNLAAMISLKAESKDIEIIYQTDLNIPFDLRGDPLRIGQILLNLSDNAVKFTERGQVIISSKLVEKNNNEATIHFTIEDTGIGMTAAQQKRLFEAFSQADTSTTRRFGGTGLGLAICRRLVQLMRGEISVDSKVDHGSSFSFSIKVGYSGEQSIGSAASTEELKSQHVLVLDKNQSTTNAIATILSTWGMHVDCCQEERDFLTALEKLASNNKPPKFVLLNRKQTAKHLLSLSRTIIHCHDKVKPQIILMANSSNAMLSEKEKDVGVSSLITKPITPRSLLDHVLAKKSDDRSSSSAVFDRINIDLSQFSKLKGLNVLLVEDNEINQVLAKKLLETIEAEVTIVNDGLECVHAVKNRDFDIILMDIQMPVMDGYTATRTIRKSDPDKKIPIVAMTAHAMAGQKEKCLEAGMNDYISKPIDPYALYQCLKDWTNAEPTENHEENSMTHLSSSFEVEFPEEWPEALPGINVKEGYYYASYNEEVFKKIIYRFLSSYENGVEEFKQHLLDNDMQSAYRWVHTLKGVAGSVGADGLNDASQMLCEVCDENSKSVDKGLVKALEQKLAEATRSLRTLLEILEHNNKTSVCGEKRLTDTSVQAQLVNLQTHLKHGDANSGNLLKDIQEQLTIEDQESLQPLNLLIDEFELDEAASKLSPFIQR